MTMQNIALSFLLILGWVTHASDYKGLGADSVSQETLDKYAPPAISRDLSRKIQLLMDQRSSGAGMIAPDGSSLFFSWAVTGSSQVWCLDGPNHFPQQVTGGEDRTAIADVSPDGKRVIISRDRAGEENPGLYWMDVKGGALHEIQHLPKVQTFFGFESADSKRLYFLSNDIKNDSYAIYRYDFKKAKREIVFSEDGLWSIDDHRGEDELLLSKRIGSLWSEYYLLKLKEKDPAKRLVPLLGQGEKEEYDMRMTRKRGEYVVITPKFGEFRRLYLFKGGKFTPLTAEIRWDVHNLRSDDAHQRVYYSINENGYNKFHVLDGANYKPVRFPEFPDADQVNVAALSSNGRFVTFNVESAQYPRTNYVYDWSARKLTKWILPSTPEVDLKTFPRAVLEYYKAEDGTDIPMFVRRPPKCATEVCPVIVDFHGGPESQSLPGFAPVYQIFLDAGFVFVEPNVRGSDGYGKTWLNSDNGPKRLNVITDIRDCASFIKKKWAKDGKVPKVGVFGGSYGGYSTQIAMTMFAGSYDAGFSVVGMSNLRTFLMNTAPYRRILRITEYGDPEKDAEALKKLSPMTYVDQVKAPMFFLQGLNDPRVPVGEAIQMHETLEKHKIPSKLVIFPDEGHGAGKRDNQVKEFGYALDFFQTYLK